MIVSIIFFIFKEQNFKKIGLPIIIFFILSTYEYYKFDSIYYSRNWPNWNEEYSKWEKNEDYEIKVWPRKNVFGIS